MREITDHIVEGDLPQNQLRIEVTDEPGAGGANHLYHVSGFNTTTNPSAPAYFGGFPGTGVDIIFQNGPIQEAGINGITNETLLAIVIDRLRSFQAGPYPCTENRYALQKCEEALGLLKLRTQARLARGVEGVVTV